MEQPVIVFGAGGLGKVALEIFQNNQIVVYGFLDDDPSLHGTTIGEVPVLGAADDQGFLKLIGKKCQAFVAIPDKKLRQDLVSMLNKQRKVMPVNAIHGTAHLATTAVMGHGNLIASGVQINTQVEIGSHNLLQTGSILDYGVVLEDFVEIGAGTVIGAEVKVGAGAFIGTGATVVSGVSIGANARIGAGSVVISNVAEHETVFGNPAQPVKGK